VFVEIPITDWAGVGSLDDVKQELLKALKWSFDGSYPNFKKHDRNVYRNVYILSCLS
jgi:SpoVK/Ycf46/Vps4 family AAA+-type ATPase